MTAQEAIEIYRKAKEAGVVMTEETEKLGSGKLPATEIIKITLQLKDRLEKFEQIRKKMQEHPEDWEL